MAANVAATNAATKARQNNFKEEAARLRARINKMGPDFDDRVREDIAAKQRRYQHYQANGIILILAWSLMPPSEKIDDITDIPGVSIFLFALLLIPMLVLMMKWGVDNLGWKNFGILMTIMVLITAVRLMLNLQQWNRDGEEEGGFKFWALFGLEDEDE